MFPQATYWPFGLYFRVEMNFEPGLKVDSLFPVLVSYWEREVVPDRRSSD
jgi:hypothetical protein